MEKISDILELMAKREKTSGVLYRLHAEKMSNLFAIKPINVYVETGKNHRRDDI